MSAPTMTPGTQARWRGPWSWVPEGAIAGARGLALCGLMLVGSGLLAAMVGAIAVLFRFGVGGHGHTARAFLVIAVIPACFLGIRRLAGLTRRLAGEWCGVPIPAPYRPAPAADMNSWVRIPRLVTWLVTDQATWRDMLWMAANAGGGFVLAAAPAGLAAFGVGALVLPGLMFPISGYPVGLTGWLAVPLGLAITALGLWAAPRLLPVYGGYARSILGPSRQAELAHRVSHLAQTRSDTIDTGAAQMRRIERDLHDGAQARLVAMGMTLDAADQLLDTSPAAARALLAEAREYSVKALAELRDLVRGIHPPVLADRGLAEAIHALALDTPFRINFASDLPGRPPAPVESAAYFSVSELLANVSKHAGAVQAWIDLRYSAGMLAISVSDDGNGGADTARGTGLSGIERRLAAFDGVLAVSSPPGGPTVVNMEIPCALSSPKTSSC